MIYIQVYLLVIILYGTWLWFNITEVPGLMESLCYKNDSDENTLFIMVIISAILWPVGLCVVINHWWKGGN